MEALREKAASQWRQKLNTLSNKEAMNTKNTNDTKNQEKEEY